MWHAIMVAVTEQCLLETETLTLTEIPVSAHRQRQQRNSSRGDVSAASAQEKWGVLMSFFTGKFRKPEKSSSWLERISRNERFNGKQMVCA